MPDVGEHYRATDGGRPAGVNRVVGTADDVVLLRVTDGNGRRINSGRLERVSAATLVSGFEPAEDPDDGFSPIREVRNAIAGLYSSVRRFF